MFPIDKPSANASFPPDAAVHTLPNKAGLSRVLLTVLAAFTRDWVELAIVAESLFHALAARSRYTSIQVERCLTGNAGMI